MVGYHLIPKAMPTLLLSTLALLRRLWTLQFPPHQPSVQKFKEAIEGDPVMKDLFNQIFLQVSKKNKVKNFEMLLYMLDHIVHSAPPYHIAKDAHGNPIGEPIGVPFYLVFRLFSNTSAGYDLFRLPRFNVAVKALLDTWGTYLQDPNRDSNTVLNSGEEGWFSTLALASLETNLGGLTFNDTYYIPDPNAENRGYKTWDEFFTRSFKPGVRPVYFPENRAHIHSPCESTVYRISYNVKAHDQFWLKAQKYSLYDMLNRDTDMTNYFTGGTVYQAFLTPFDFHRWHSPVDGVIKNFVIVPGTYYAALPDEGAPLDDPAGSPYDLLFRSQAFLTLTAARALIYIEADNPEVGLVCFMGVGMAEVSTCDVTVVKNQQVKKGDQIGMFHFGGSSHTPLSLDPTVTLHLQRRPA